jgi:nitroreductase
MNVTEATLARSSIRAFRAQPVPMPLLREILAVAARSPSGGNLQPWRVYALTNDSLRSLTVAVKVKLAADQIETPEYAVYPANLWEPFRTRRFRAGEELHSKIDVPRADRAARLRQVNRNYAFFDAPVGLIFCIDRRLGAAQWLDLGICSLPRLRVVVTKNSPPHLPVTHRAKRGAPCTCSPARIFPLALVSAGTLRNRPADFHNRRFRRLAAPPRTRSVTL